MKLASTFQRRILSQIHRHLFEKLPFLDLCGFELRLSKLLQCLPRFLLSNPSAPPFASPMAIVLKYLKTFFDRQRLSFVLLLRLSSSLPVDEQSLPTLHYFSFLSSWELVSRVVS